jgi:hypothetical protein
MTGKPATDVKGSAATWIGLFLSLFGMLIIRQAFRFLAPSITTTPMALKERFDPRLRSLRAPEFAYYL